jgi:hypothetical protein
MWNLSVHLKKITQISYAIDIDKYQVSETGFITNKCRYIVNCLESWGDSGFSCSIMQRHSSKTFFKWLIHETACSLFSATPTQLNLGDSCSRLAIRYLSWKVCQVILHHKANKNLPAIYFQSFLVFCGVKSFNYFSTYFKCIYGQKFACLRKRSIKLQSVESLRNV